MKVKFLFFIVLLIYSFPTFANPLLNPNGHSLRIVPLNSSYTRGPLTIQVKSSEFHAQLHWFAQVRHQVKTEPWPEYKVSLSKGMIQSDEIRQAPFMTHPFLWKSGFIYLDQNTLIWAPKSIFEKKEIEFEIGLLNNDFKQFASKNKKLFESVASFRTNLNSYAELQLFPNEFLSQSQKKDLDSFLKKYPKINYLRENLRPLVIDNEKKEVSVIDWGNDYVEFSILNIPTNPLILKFEIKLEKIPEPLQNDFKVFKENLEYVITQIKT